VPGYKIETLDVEMVQMFFEDLSTSGSAEERANHIAEYTKVACDASMQRRGKTPSRRTPAYWWNQSIAEARKDCHRARRAYKRSRGRPEFEALPIYFREKRRVLEKTIKKSKRRCFNNICKEIDSSPWGFAYKLITKRLRVCSRPSPPCPVNLKRIVETLFPEQEGMARASLIVNRASIKLTSAEEVFQVLKTILDDKAPGPDRIPNKVLKIAKRANTKE